MYDYGRLSISSWPSVRLQHESKIEEPNIERGHAKLSKEIKVLDGSRQSAGAARINYSFVYGSRTLVRMDV